MSEDRGGWQELIDRRCDGEIDDAAWMALVDRHGPELGRALKRERAIRRTIAEGTRPGMPDGLKRAILAEVANTPQVDTEAVSREKEATTRALRRREEESRSREPGGKVIPWVVVTGGLLAAGLSLAVIPGLWDDGGTRGGDDTAANGYAYEDTGAKNDEREAGSGPERPEQAEPERRRPGGEVLSELEEASDKEAGRRHVARKKKGEDDDALGVGLRADEEKAIEPDAGAVVADRAAPSRGAAGAAAEAEPSTPTDEGIPADELQALVAEAEAFARQRRATDPAEGDAAAKERTEGTGQVTAPALPLDFRIRAELAEGRLAVTGLTVVNRGDEPVSIAAERLVLFGLDRAGEVAYRLAAPLRPREPLPPGDELEIALERTEPPDERVRHLVLFLGDRRTDPVRWTPPSTEAVGRDAAAETEAGE